MLPRIFDIALDVVRFGSVSVFLGVVSSFLFLLLVPKERREVYLSKPAVRRFVEYLGHVSFGDEGPAARHGLKDPSAGYKAATRA